MNKIFSPALSALFLLSIIWSYNWIVMKSVLAYIAPLEFASLRCFAGAFILFAILFFAKKRLTPPPLLPTLLIGLFQIGGMTGLSQLALLAGGAGKTAVLSYTMPFWVIILAALFLKEKTDRTQKIAFLAAALGLLLVIEPWGGETPLLSSVLAVASGLFWAVGIVMVKRLYIKIKVDLIGLTAWQMFFGAVMLGVLALFMHKEPVIWGIPLAKALLYNAFLSTAFASVLWLYILRTLPAGIAGLSTLLVPALSVLLAWLKLGEKPDFYEAAGIILIICALLLISLPGLVKERRLRAH